MKINTFYKSAMSIDNSKMSIDIISDKLEQIRCGLHEVRYI